MKKPNAKKSGVNRQWFEVRADFLIVLGMVLAAIPIILLTHARFLTSTMLFFALPAAFLLFRQPKQLKRLGVSLVAGMIICFIVDFLAEFNGAWSWAPVGQLVFPNMLFGLVPIDVLIWYFFWLLLTIVYYEHFFEYERSEKISGRFAGGLLFFAVMLIVLLVMFHIHPETLRFRYAYFFVGVVGAIPFYYVIAKKPKLLWKLLKAGVFNAFLFLSFELTALWLDQWRFPGEYIGTLTVSGLRFPIEEFVFWILLGTPIVLSYYELFVDDER